MTTRESPYYNGIWNLLDFPASVIPFQKAERSIDTEEVLGYDPAVVDGVPSHIQIVGWRSQDEEVLLATEVNSEVLR
jgi:amidase